MARAGRRAEEVAYTLVRVVTGLLFAVHGAVKVLGVPSGTPVELFSLLGLAGAIELAAGLLVAAGVVVGWAGIVASGEMAVAYFMAHASRGFWPHANHGELAVLYCFVFLYVAFRGPGEVSVSALLDRRTAGAAADDGADRSA